MFREMRRKKQQLSEFECIDILDRMTSGTLAIEGDENYPYAVPLSFAYDNGKIYFHSAKAGHKIDALKRNDKASFCVIAQDNVKPEEYTTYFKSVIAFGKLRILTGTQEKYAALQLLADKYAPGETKNRQKEIGKGFDSLLILELNIEHLTGKQAIELSR